MLISSVNNQMSSLNSIANPDALLNSLIKAKENLSSQIQKINKDKSLDEKSKQEKTKQLQAQIEEIDRQIQKHQMKKITENAQKINKEPGDSSISKTAEDRKKDAGISMDRSIISAAANGKQLKELGAIRDILIIEDKGISERVKRTERMMGEHTVEINKELAKNRAASRELADANKEIEENRKNEENNVGEEKAQEKTAASDVAIEVAENSAQAQNDEKTASALAETHSGVKDAGKRSDKQVTSVTDRHGAFCQV